MTPAEGFAYGYFFAIYLIPDLTKFVKTPKSTQKILVIKSTHTQGTCYQIPTYAKHLLSNLYIRKAPDNISTHTPIFVYLLKVFRYVSTHTNRAFSTYPSEVYIAENNVE